MKFVLLLALSLFMTLPASAKANLFAVGLLPPDITAHDRDDKVYHLHSLRDKKRVVLLSVQNAAYLNGVRQHQEQFTERDIIVLTAELNGYQFYLIGKDGHIKMARRTPVPNTELFAVIDAMPMRRAEMQKRK